MMSTAFQAREFEVINAALRAWPDAAPPPPDSSTPARRLMDAAGAAAEAPGSVGAPDLAVLLRHVLRAEAEITGTEKGLRVPRTDPWPKSSDWGDFSMAATEVGGEQVVFANAWEPEWLTAATSDPAAAAYRGFRRESLGEVYQPVADPFLTSLTGLSSYRSAGQREAIRAVLATPAGATIIGNLPTGTGKSLVAYVPALVSDAPGTTIVVVPTTSLALDQERAFREFVLSRGDRLRSPSELAYHGELDDATRSTVRSRIADGSQSIVFTSPESLLHSLSPAVYKAAERGLLSAFVIDEAHIVSQWGAEFRPAFQALAGTRADLLRVASLAAGPFKTILLSATLTEESLLTLQGLFGRPGPTEFISSVALRDEPSYWLASCDDEDLRAERVVECLRHLPRPLVLYTTRVADAKLWNQLLTRFGYRRHMIVAGETKAAGRREAIERLRAGSLDLVVGTSAFGLGVDQPDLRAVVHACIPETIDRYYQEVGRGGRDGRPSVAALVAAPRDRGVADGLSKRKLISLERGLERWEWMRGAARPHGEGMLRVPLTVSPPDIAGDSAENRAWNMRTLLLMDRGGLITLDAVPPPRRAPDESDEEWEERAAADFDDYASHAVLRIQEGALGDPDSWDRAVGVARSEAIAADRLSRSRMDRALDPDAKLCSLFAETYRLGRALPGIGDRQIPVPVAQSCGGCPGCRAAGLKPRRYPPPVPFPANGTNQVWSQEFLPWFAGRSTVAVLYDAEDWTDAIIRGLERLARHGLWCLMAPNVIVATSVVRNLHRIAPGRAIFHLDRWDLLRAPLLPTALVFSPDAAVPEAALEDRGPRRVVFAPAGARDPRHEAATIGEYHAAVTTARDLSDRI